MSQLKLHLAQIFVESIIKNQPVRGELWKETVPYYCSQTCLQQNRGCMKPFSACQQVPSTTKS